MSGKVREPKGGASDILSSGVAVMLKPSNAQIAIALKALGALPRTPSRFVAMKGKRVITCDDFMELADRIHAEREIVGVWADVCMGSQGVIRDNLKRSYPLYIKEQETA